MEVKSQILESIRLKQVLLQDTRVESLLKQTVERVVHAYRTGGKVLFCGNGGSAADAQHLAAELSGCFYLNRPPLNAEALHVNGSFLTATANDHSFDQVYKRMVQAVGKRGDILMAFSTSGKSENIIQALEAARNLNMYCVGFTGQHGAGMSGLCDLVFEIPSADTPRIQEIHMLLGHIICEQVESILFN